MRPNAVLPLLVLPLMPLPYNVLRVGGCDWLFTERATWFDRGPSAMADYRTAPLSRAECPPETGDLKSFDAYVPSPLDWLWPRMGIDYDYHRRELIEHQQYTIPPGTTYPDEWRTQLLISKSRGRAWEELVEFPPWNDPDFPFRNDVIGADDPWHGLLRYADGVWLQGTLFAGVAKSTDFGRTWHGVRRPIGYETADPFLADLLYDRKLVPARKAVLDNIEAPHVWGFALSDWIVRSIDNGWSFDFTLISDVINPSKLPPGWGETNGRIKPPYSALEYGGGVWLAFAVSNNPSGFDPTNGSCQRNLSPQMNQGGWEDNVIPIISVAYEQDIFEGTGNRTYNPAWNLCKYTPRGDGSGPGRFWVYGQSGYLLYSDDLGVTWNKSLCDYTVGSGFHPLLDAGYNTSSSKFGFIADMAQNPKNPDHIVVVGGRWDLPGLRRGYSCSFDGGDTWKPVVPLPDLDAQRVVAMCGSGVPIEPDPEDTVGEPCDSDFTITNFRFQRGDGTPLLDPSTATDEAGGEYRIRFAVKYTGTETPLQNVQFRLLYQKVSPGPFVPVPTDHEATDWWISGAYKPGPGARGSLDGADLLQEISTGSFVNNNNGLDTMDGIAGPMDMFPDQTAEVEFIVRSKGLVSHISGFWYFGLGTIRDGEITHTPFCMIPTIRINIEGQKELCVQMKTWIGLFDNGPMGTPGDADYATELPKWGGGTQQPGDDFEVTTADETLECLGFVEGVPGCRTPDGHWRFRVRVLLEEVCGGHWFADPGTGQAPGKPGLPAPFFRLQARRNGGDWWLMFPTINCPKDENFHIGAHIGSGSPSAYDAPTNKCTHAVTSPPSGPNFYNSGGDAGQPWLMDLIGEPELRDRYVWEKVAAQWDDQVPPRFSSFEPDRTGPIRFEGFDVVEIEFCMAVTSWDAFFADACDVRVVEGIYPGSSRGQPNPGWIELCELGCEGGYPNGYIRAIVETVGAFGCTGPC